MQLAFRFCRRRRGAQLRARGPGKRPRGTAPPRPAPRSLPSAPRSTAKARAGGRGLPKATRGETRTSTETLTSEGRTKRKFAKKNNDYKKARGAKPSSVSDRKRVGTTWPPRLPRALGRPGAATCVTTSIREGGRGELRAVAARPLRGDSRSIQIRRASSPLRPRLPPVRGRPDVAKNGCRGELHAVAARGDCIPRLARLAARPINVFAALCNWVLHPRGPRVRGRPDVA